MSGQFVHCDYKLDEQSTDLAVTLIEVKSYLKVANTEDDDLIKQLIRAATRIFEAFTGQDLTEKTYTILCSGFPHSNSFFPFFGDCHTTGGKNCLEIRRFPLREVIAINFLENGLSITWDPSEFEVNEGNNSHYPFIFPVDDFPTVDCDVPRPVEIFITTGYGPPVTIDIPDAIKIGLMQHIAFLYENRGDCACICIGASSLPQASQMLYSDFIIYKLQNEWLC